jgi:hypothetical protein
MDIEQRVKSYMEKLEGIDSEKDNLKGDYYLQSRIEAHLEMLCLLGFLDILEKGKRGGKKVQQND